MDNSKPTKRIIIGSDHAGYSLKEHIISSLSDKGFIIIDIGTHSKQSCDYPVFASKLCEGLNKGTADLGILCCGTGIGMSIAANKIKGIRAAACSDIYSAKYTRLHNDANVLCLGARVIGEGLADELVNIFISTEFEGGKHKRRVDMISALEQ